MKEFLKQLLFAVDPQVVYKVVVIIAVIVVVLVLVKTFNSVFSRFQRKLIKKLRKKTPTAVSSAETKIIITQRITNFTLYFLGLVFILLQFEAVRNIGTGLLASAGVIGIVIGVAAQSTFSNLIAGISISFAQPIRLNDAVIFENEWGFVEEISLMHTIIRTWDNRRIIVPNNVLANKVIQNWTIKDPTLLGIVMLYLDYTADLEQIKKWAKEIIEQSPYSTEEKLAVVQVIDFTEKTMVVRILGKGPDSSRTWQLRCQIREELIKKFKEKGMRLPVIRLEGAQFEVKNNLDNKKI
ncbi:MAG: mechanosensitive ion channel family protein [Candidatus Omnitrophica bacterium]|nr:mechanosensitive ion channel family protein [Candidatus Omnitrophota bacterium]